jgi:hypothetical protein
MEMPSLERPPLIGEWCSGNTTVSKTVNQGSIPCSSANQKERNLSKQERTSAEQKAINQWLKTNKPTVCPPMQRSDPDKIVKKWGWGSKKKK